MVARKLKYKHSVKFSCIYSYFFFKLQQNKEIVILWEIEWISSVMIWTLDAHKNLIWLACRHFFLIKIDKLMRYLVLLFQMLN